MSDELALGIRSARQPFLPQELPRLVQMLLIDDLPPRPVSLAPPPSASLGSEGGLPSGGPPSGPSSQPVSAERSGIHHALMHAVTADDLRWHRAEGIDACAGVTAPHNWCIMLPLSQRVQPGVYTLMALSRYRDALVRHAPPFRAPLWTGTWLDSALGRA